DGLLVKPASNSIPSQPASDVSASQPASDVSASQPASDVSASQPASDVSASQPASDVSASQPASDDSALRPASDVSASQPASDVSASQSNTLYCSFCGKSQYEVFRLIAGPTVFICDECSDLCEQIVDDSHKGEQATKINELCEITLQLTNGTL